MNLHLFLLKLCLLGQLMNFNASASRGGITILKTQDDLETIARNIVNNLSRGDYEAVRNDFSESLKQQLSSKQIEDAWVNFTSGLGKFQEISTIRAKKVQGYDQIRARCKFQYDNGTVEVTFNEDGKVIGLYVRP